MYVISLTKKDSWFLFLMFLLGLWRDLAEGEEGIGGDALLDELRSKCFHIYFHLSRLSRLSRLSMSFRQRIEKGIHVVVVVVVHDFIASREGIHRECIGR